MHAPVQMNTAKWPFSIDEDALHVIVDVALPRFLDSAAVSRSILTVALYYGSLNSAAVHLHMEPNSVLYSGCAYHGRWTPRWSPRTFE